MINRIFLIVIFILIEEILLRILLRNFRRVSPGNSYPAVLNILNNLINVGFAITTIVYFIQNQDPGNNFVAYRNYFGLFNVFILIYFSKFIIVIIFLLGELFRLTLWMWHRWFSSLKKLPLTRAFHIRRGFALGGILAGLVFFAFALYGILGGVNRFVVKHVDLYFPDLPAAFEGFTIAQISDIHLGSWTHQEDVAKGIYLLENQKPDMVCITGDIINVNSDETFPYKNLFAEIKAAYGKFAILGNHDMGDYTRFGRRDFSEHNIPGIKSFFDSTGFVLIRNSHVYIHKGKDSFALLGTDNWSMRKFKRYGKLNDALRGTKRSDFKVLMSHDPSHWRAQVMDSTSVNLMLSGHTHGMQLGIDLPWLRWSPVALVLKEWMGLYQNRKQYLYVNAGFGFLGFSGRIGIPPEITIITLHKQ